LNYRNIVKLNIRAALMKKEKARNKQEQEYWDKIVAELIADLRAYEEEALWKRNTAGLLRIAPIFNIDEIIKRFLEDF